MIKEYTGLTDSKGKKLYIGDTVIADTTGVKGKIGKHFDNYTYKEPQEVYHVDWGDSRESLKGITLNHIYKP